MAKKWIQAMHMKKGALHRQLGVPQGQKISAFKIASASRKRGVLGKRARLAQTLSKLRRG